MTASSYLPPEEARRVMAQAIASGRISVKVERKKPRKRQRRGPRKKPCRQCGKSFTPTYKANTLCGPECKRKRHLVLKAANSRKYRLIEKQAKYDN